VGSRRVDYRTWLSGVEERMRRLAATLPYGGCQRLRQRRLMLGLSGPGASNHAHLFVLSLSNPRLCKQRLVTGLTGIHLGIRFSSHTEARVAMAAPRLCPTTTILQPRTSP
jgi:hypothetical protein